MYHIARLGCSYSEALYKLLDESRTIVGTGKRKIGKKHIDIADLVTMWRIPSSLQAIDTIKRVVLVPAIKELHSKGLIKIELGTSFGILVWFILFVLLMFIE